MIVAMRSVALLVLAACSNGGGVQISVRENGTGATNVHLYLGTGEQIERAPIFLDEQTPLGTTYASRDPGGDADIEKVTGGAANFFFPPAGDSLTIPLAIAIGFDDANKVVGAGLLEYVGVPDKGYLSYDLVLDKSSNVEAWDENGRTPSLQSKCVQLDDKMIVSPHDEDCDALLDGDPKECDPHTWFHQLVLPAPDQFTCARIDTTSSPNGCYAGGQSSCRDGAGTLPIPDGADQNCPVLSKYCGPLADCPFINRDDNIFSAPAYFRCKVPFHDGKVCKTTFALPEGTEACSNVRARNDQQSFQNVLVVNGLGDPVTFEVLVNNDCDISLKTDGGGNAALATTQVGIRDQQFALIAADTGPNLGFLVPVHFELGNDGCADAPVECSWMGAGSVDKLSRDAICDP